MNTVQKFSLTVADQLEVEMPLGAQLLHVALVKARPCLWALVDESRPRVRRRFRLTATSEPIPDHLPDWKFVGSVLVGANDCHLWDLGERSGNA
ncbi:MAG TPA: hypothetical protein VN914_11240 [Polyangia bacterium]|nr:hypothetical protein [Polyangia bacterium]